MCESDEDCNPGVCCGCVEEQQCVNGVCEILSDVDICYDAFCCFSPYGCGPERQMNFPRDFDGSCNGMECEYGSEANTDYYVNEGYACYTETSNGTYSVEEDICGLDLTSIYWEREGNICVQVHQIGIPSDECTVPESHEESLVACCGSNGICGIQSTDQLLGCIQPQLANQLYGVILEQIECTYTPSPLGKRIKTAISTAAIPNTKNR